MSPKLLLFLFLAGLTSLSSAWQGLSWRKLPVPRRRALTIEGDASVARFIPPSPRLNLAALRIRVGNSGRDANPTEEDSSTNTKNAVDNQKAGQHTPRAADASTMQAGSTSNQIDDAKSKDKETDPSRSDMLEGDKSGLVDGNIIESVTDAEQTTRKVFNDSGSNVTAVRWINDSVTIGKQAFRKEIVTPVGDIDGNGYADLVVASPLAAHGAGSIRLYLMRANDQFLFSRELVPGQWGFLGDPLKAGDLYGTSVHKLPNSDYSAPCVLAVGAPGDGINKHRGAIYIFQVSERGNVSKSTKISAETEKSLARQHVDNEGFGIEISSVGDINGDGDHELSVKSRIGSTTVLFLSPDHHLKTGLKMHNEGGSGLMGLMESSTTPNPKLELDNVAVRPGVGGTCFFNDTNCACGLKPAEVGSATCIDFVQTDPDTDESLCIARDCKPSYVCSCDGSELCSRTEETRQLYVPGASAGGGKVFCAPSSMTMTINTVLVGVPIPTPEVLSERLSPFNATHCRCSSKSQLVEPYQCLDVFRTQSTVAVICRSRDCKTASDEYTCDGIGSSYCERHFVPNNHYVNDGDVFGESGSVYCHQVVSTKEQVKKLFDV